MTEIIYLLTVMYALYVIDKVAGGMPVYLLGSFFILVYLVTL